jgi:tetratricopeptide (TPR) repeat protein
MHRPVTIRSAYWLRRAALLGGVTVWALACASAEKRYKQGLEFEAQGRYPEAAFHYAEALRKEPGLEPARARLRETGPLAIQDLLRRAQTAQSLGRHDEAAEHFLQLDRLLRESAAVGVTLDAPEGYASRRRAALDRAIESMLEAGYAALARGSFNEALAAYARAGERYEPDPTQQAQLLRATRARLRRRADARVLDASAPLHRDGRGRRGSPGAAPDGVRQPDPLLTRRRVRRPRARRRLRRAR